MTKMLKMSFVTLLIFHLCLVLGFELAHDEAYYWLFSKNLDWGYFDHPPMVAIIIKLFSFLPHSELSVRFGFVVLQLVAAALLLAMLPRQRQWVGLLLFFAFPLASFAGLFALPDLPLLLMTVLYCFFLKRFLEKSDISTSIILGFVITLLLYSKYHGILLIFFTLLAVPKLLLKKDFYLVALVAMLGFLPHLWWQYIHDFATLRYHFFERPKADFSFMRLIEYLGTQVALAGFLVGPMLWWIVIKTKTTDQFSRAMKFVSIGTVFFFLVSTISKKFEANWTVFLVVPLVYLGSDKEIWEKKLARILLVSSFAVVMAARILLLFGPEKIGIKRLSEFHGWQTWAKQVDEKCQDPILANTYQVASKLAFYLEQPIHALNYHSRKNQFDYWQPESDYYQTTKVCYVTDKKQFGGEIIYSPQGKKLRVVQGFVPGNLATDIP